MLFVVENTKFYITRQSQSDIFMRLGKNKNQVFTPG